MRRRASVYPLDAGADISARDEEYRSTPLAWAARRQHPKIVSILRNHGAG